LKECKWQGYIGWAESDSEHLTVAYELGMKDAVLVKERLTKHYKDFKDVITEIQEIRNENVVQDFQILAMKIWRLPKHTGQVRVRSLKKDKTAR
jgi:hypothetical protein